MARKKTEEEKEQMLKDDLDYQIADCIEKHQKKTMGELWESLDKIKAKFAKRWKKLVEGKRHNLDQQDAGSNE